MSDLIRRSDAIEAIRKHIGVPYSDENVGLGVAIHELNTLPSASRPTGEWKYKEKESADGLYSWRECSVCGRKPLLDRWNHMENLSDFCPSCGADMRGEDDEGNV